MLPLKRAVLLAVAVGLVAASPASAGSDGPPPALPGLVNSRLVRVQNALDKAVGYADDAQPNRAATQLYAARLQVKLAWRATQYIIENTTDPAPVGDLGPVRRSTRSTARKLRRLRKAGVRARAAATADKATTAGAVFEAQHNVAQTAFGMIDSAHGALRDSLSRTIFLALDQRDAAIEYVHAHEPPPPPAGLARASGAPVGAGGYAGVMPGVGEQIDDEIVQIEGALALSSTMGAGIRRTYQQAEFQGIKSRRKIDQYWPPVVGD
jgi:hypothetical protein